MKTESLIISQKARPGRLMHLSATCTNWPWRTGNWRKTYPGDALCEGSYFYFIPSAASTSLFHCMGKEPGLCCCRRTGEEIACASTLLLLLFGPKASQEAAGDFFVPSRANKKLWLTFIVGVENIVRSHKNKLKEREREATPTITKENTHIEGIIGSSLRAILSFSFESKHKEVACELAETQSVIRMEFSPRRVLDEKTRLRQWVLNFAILNKFYCERIQCKDPKHQSSAAGRLSHMAAAEFLFRLCCEHPENAHARQERHTRIALLREECGVINIDRRRFAKRAAENAKADLQLVEWVKKRKKPRPQMLEISYTKQKLNTLHMQSNVFISESWVHSSANTIWGSRKRINFLDEVGWNGFLAKGSATSLSMFAFYSFHGQERFIDPGYHKIQTQISIILVVEGGFQLSLVKKNGK
jgi:hypothetical protein